MIRSQPTNRRASLALRAIVATNVLAALVVGVPIVLITLVGWPLPTTLPTVDGIALAFNSGVSSSVVINMLGIVIWIAWAQLTVAVTVEAIAVARGSMPPRLLMPAGFQTTAANLIAAITLATATLGPLRPAPIAAHPPTTETTTTQLTTAKPHPAASPSDLKPALTQSPMSVTVYDVARFDTFWSIAERTLGDGQRWREIRDHNIGRVMTDGTTITNETDHLPTGTHLHLPADATTNHTHTVTVAKGDSLWSIARTTLHRNGTPDPTGQDIANYLTILIAANRDRLVEPSNPNLIHPGQVLDVPIPETTDDHTAEAPHADAHTVEQGDTLSIIVHHTLATTWDREPTRNEAADYLDRVITLNRHRLVEPSNPNLIHPGQVFDLPPIPPDPATNPIPTPKHPTAADTPPATNTPREPAPVAMPHTDTPPSSHPTDTASYPPVEPPSASRPRHSPPALAPPPAISETSPSDADAFPADETESVLPDLFPTATRLAGLGILAAGIVALLTRLRHIQLRRRTPGTAPPTPPPDATATEKTMRESAAPDTTTTIQGILAELASDLDTAGAPPLDLVGVYVTPTTISALLWTPRTDTPPDWTVDDAGHTWHHPHHTPPTTAHHTIHPYPALVTIGHGTDSHLLINLDHAAAIQVTGNPDTVEAVMATMALELATSSFADHLDLLCIGFTRQLPDLERIHTAATIEAILPDLAGIATNTQPGFTPPHHHIIDATTPTIVIDATSQPTDATDQLLTYAHATPAISAVVGYPTSGPWTLHVTDDNVHIEPLGHTLKRRNITTTEHEDITELVTTAQRTDTEPLPQPTESDALRSTALKPPPPADMERTLRTAIDQSEDVPCLKVLGHLRVENLERPFPLRKCTELIAYLTFHPHGVEHDTLMEALWPEQPPDNQRLQRHASRTRTSLGRTPTGDPYLAYAKGGLYQLHPDLTADHHTFAHHTTTAAATTGVERHDHLHTALNLVEGAPFTGAANGYTWAHTNGIATHLTIAIDEAAHQLTDHYLHDNNTRQARWAARKGIDATTICEHCYRNLMQCAIADNNHVALEATLTELLTVLDADDGPDSYTYLEPATIDLYETHTRARRKHAG